MQETVFHIGVFFVGGEKIEPSPHCHLLEFPNIYREVSFDLWRLVLFSFLQSKPFVPPCNPIFQSFLFILTSWQCSVKCLKRLGFWYTKIISSFCCKSERTSRCRGEKTEKNVEQYFKTLLQLIY